VIADRFSEYKADGNIESAIKCCHTRRIISKSLRHEDDLGAMADLCEIALEQSLWQIAIDRAKEALKVEPHGFN
jgi:hypothetical protein